MNPKLSLSVGAVIGCLLAAAPSYAQEVKAGDLVISRAWSRATPGGSKVASGYLTIENKGANADRLIGGSTAIAAKLEVHEMTMSKGVMTMHPAEGGLAIPAGKTVTLSPGAYHLMITELKTPLKEGSTFAATLQFEHAGKIDVTFNVQGIGAKGPAGGPARDDKDHGAMDHGKMKM